VFINTIRIEQITDVFHLRHIGKHENNKNEKSTIETIPKSRLNSPTSSDP